MGAMNDRAIDARNADLECCLTCGEPLELGIFASHTVSFACRECNDRACIADESRQLALLHWAKTPVTTR